MREIKIAHLVAAERSGRWDELPSFRVPLIGARAGLWSVSVACPLRQLQKALRCFRIYHRTNLPGDICHGGFSGFGSNVDSAEIVIAALRIS